MKNMFQNLFYVRMIMKKLLLSILALSFAHINATPATTKPIHFTDAMPEAMKLAALFLPEKPVILEAGAYNGDDSKELLKFFAGATLHSFEPIPYLFEQLTQKTNLYPDRLRTYPYALSDTCGTANMHISEVAEAPGIPTQSSSLLAPKEHKNQIPGILFKHQITVQTTTIDDWAKKNNVDHIDFMWLDMQGYELNALKASPNILKTVKVILTEVEFIEAYAGQYLFKDIKEWLEAEGFTMIAENFHPLMFFGDALFVRK